MSNPVKVILYAVLVLLASVSGYFALTNFGRMMDRATNRNSDLEQIEPERKPAADSTADNSSSALADSGTTNSATTNVVSLTNTTAVIAGTLSTNQASVSNLASNKLNSPANTKTAGTVPNTTTTNNKAPLRKTGSHVGFWAALFVVSVLGLGLLIANDVAQFMGNRALKTLYNDDGETQKDPEYDQAEEVWANGEYLESINMMREYLATHPREQHVAIRIAEIYEKDLKNNLAAALEYEEVLKQKLAPERWAWAAVHLCNLYFRLNHEQKGFELLRRIVDEHPNTSAAEKARKRLEQVDSSMIPEQIATEPQVKVAALPRAPRSQSPDSQSPQGNLPPGFRPRK